MTATAFLVGGTGQIGDATARALLAAGYAVTVGSRAGAGLPGVEADSAVVDRDDPEGLRAAVSGFDLVVDAVAYTPEHARALVALGSSIGSLVVISTGSVYLGDNGLAFDDVRDRNDYPVFPVPVTERQPTIDRPGSAYGASKAAMERVLLDQSALPVSVLRPGSVHGPRSRKIREWYFIKRALDGRERVVLARSGTQRFSTSSTLNIASLVVACAARPGIRALNAVDDESPTMTGIAETVYDLLGGSLEVVAFDGPPVGDVGATPWDSPIDFVCSMDAARAEVGYSAAVSYRDAVAADIAWITTELGEAGHGRDWRTLFPASAPAAGSAGWFPYEDEDRWLAARR
jgi:nucleoside-diphosphate-sugar epimerase